MNVPALLSATTFIYFSFNILDQGFCGKAQPFQAGLQRDPKRLSRHAQFVEHFYHVLDVPKIEGIAVQTETDCLLRCMRNDRCFSINVAAFPRPDGTLSCDLLPTDKYNASDKFKANHTFHLYSIMSPCENSPCQHGGTCRAIYETGNYSCACTRNYTGKNCEIIVDRDCFNLFKAGNTQSGVYSVNPDGIGHFKVYCDMRTDGGGWTVFQRRQDGSVNFYRGWNDYKSGLGKLTAEFWLGNNKIHRLTASRPSSLRVELEDWNGNRAYAKYEKFNIGDEQAQYRLEVGSYSGTAGNSIARHNNMAFTTKDRDNDRWSSGNCAVPCTGAWWYTSCYFSNLNGQYLGDKSDARGSVWLHFRRYLSLKSTEMKLRPAS